FLIITVGTLEQFATTLYQPANFQFIGQTPYSILVFVQDIFTFAVLLAVGYACYRRCIIRPEGLGISKDANIVLALTGSLMVSILFMNGFHILGADPWYQAALPVSNIIAGWLSGLSLEADTYSNISTFFKWIHMTIVLGFAVYIPRSKHLHI